MNQSPSRQFEVGDAFRILRRRKWVLLFCVLAFPLAAYGVSSRIKRTYQANAVIQVQGAAVDTTLFSQGQSVSEPQAIAATAKLVRTNQVAGPASRLLRPRPPSLQALLTGITVAEDDLTGFVTITATEPSAQRSADVVNAFATAVVSLRSAQAQGQVNQTIDAVARRLATIPRSDPTARSQLSEQLQRLRAVSAAQVNNAQVIQLATPPVSPASPRPIRNAALALVLGILLGVGLAFLRDRLDRRIRTPEELREIIDLPLLSLVPSAAFRVPTPDTSQDEAYLTLRTSLTYFNVDRPLRSILVASAGAGDGKTTVAINLAVSFARSGKTVIVIDADLRRSHLAERLQLQMVGDGLGVMLATEGRLEDGLVEVPVPGGGRLWILPAGPPPPNPSELLSSERMARLLAAACDLADLVVIDSSPLLPVSDSVPLLSQTSGVVALVRMKRTTRDGLRRFQEIAQLAGGNVFGVVATDCKGGKGYGYGYESAHRPAETPLDHQLSADLPADSGSSHASHAK